MKKAQNYSTLTSPLKVELIKTFPCGLSSVQDEEELLYNLTSKVQLAFNIQGFGIYGFKYLHPI